MTDPTGTAPNVYLRRPAASPKPDDGMPLRRRLNNAVFKVGGIRSSTTISNPEDAMGGWQGKVLFQWGEFWEVSDRASVYGG